MTTVLYKLNEWVNEFDITGIEKSTFAGHYGEYAIMRAAAISACAYIDPTTGRITLTQPGMTNMAKALEEILAMQVVDAGVKLLGPVQMATMNNDGDIHVDDVRIKLDHSECSSAHPIALDVTRKPDDTAPPVVHFAGMNELVDASDGLGLAGRSSEDVSAQGLANTIHQLRDICCQQVTMIGKLVYAMEATMTERDLTRAREALKHD